MVSRLHLLRNQCGLLFFGKICGHRVSLDRCRDLCRHFRSDACCNGRLYIFNHRLACLRLQLRSNTGLNRRQNGAFNAPLHFGPHRGHRCRFDALLHRALYRSQRCAFDAFAHRGTNSGLHRLFDALAHRLLDFFAHRILNAFFYGILDLCEHRFLDALLHGLFHFLRHLLRHFPGDLLDDRVRDLGPDLIGPCRDSLRAEPLHGLNDRCHFFKIGIGEGVEVGGTIDRDVHVRVIIGLERRFGKPHQIRHAAVSDACGAQAEGNAGRDVNNADDGHLRDREAVRKRVRCSRGQREDITHLKRLAPRSSHANHTLVLLFRKTAVVDPEPVQIIFIPVRQVLRDRCQRRYRLIFVLIAAHQHIHLISAKNAL